LYTISWYLSNNTLILVILSLKDIIYIYIYI
jgi:hypothetical protein